jgi:serine/threonine protein kinase
MALTSSSRLGPYEIQSLLGVGGMGEVYRARDTRLDRRVAVKVLPAHFAADPQFRERLDREAKTISQHACCQILPMLCMYLMYLRLPVARAGISCSAGRTR